MRTPPCLGLLCLGLLCLLATTGCRNPKPEELQIFCAASLGPAIKETCESEGIPASFHLGGSHALVRQENLGARADLLLLADDLLAHETLAPKGYDLLPLATNRLVVIAPRSMDNAKPADFQEALLSGGSARLAVADPKTAPLGGYTAEALRGVKQHLKLVPMQDARAVLTAVSLGHAERGIVYRTDALNDPDVTLLAEIPPQFHKAILYVAVTPPKPSTEALRLIQSLRDGQGRRILDKQGFLPLDRIPQARATP